VNEQDGFYRTLLGNLYDGVYFVNRDCRITYWNSGAESIAGYSRSEVVGSRCSDNVLMHVDEDGQCLCQGLMCPLEETMSDGKSRTAEVFLHHRNGHRVPVRVRTQGKVPSRWKSKRARVSRGARRSRPPEANAVDRQASPHTTGPGPLRHVPQRRPLAAQPLQAIDQASGGAYSSSLKVTVAWVPSGGRTPARRVKRRRSCM